MGRDLSVCDDQKKKKSNPFLTVKENEKEKDT